MREIEPTWGIAFRVWLSFFWQSLVFILLGSFILGFLVGFFGSFIGIDDEQAALIAGGLGFVWGLLIGVWIIKRVLKLDTGRFRIAVIEVEG